MAKKEFILQGFTARTHADAVTNLFGVTDIKRVLISVAFANDGGAELIEKPLSIHADKTTVFVGIRNEVTTIQGLARLWAIGVNLYAVDTGARTLIFHPKLYMVRGEKEAKAIIGSANLTLGGLNNNIEAGILLAFDLTNKDDKEVLDGIEKQFDALPQSYPQHVLKIGGKTDLELMLDNGRLLDEMAARPPRPVAVAKTVAGDTVPRIKLKVPPIKAKSQVKVAAKAVKAAQLAPATALIKSGYELVWESSELTRRSLTIPSGATSNPTGSTLLGKGNYTHIDQATYFRNEVFGKSAWDKYTNKAGNVAEATTANFAIVVKGINYGTYPLRVTHSLTRAAVAAKDHNSPTEISWGIARKFIAREDLLDRTLRLYRSKADENNFIIEID